MLILDTGKAGAVAAAKNEENPVKEDEHTESEDFPS